LPSEWLTVEDRLQARLLSEEASSRYFEPFLARERTVSQAAAEVGCGVDTMLYRVRTFLAAGLLRVTSVQKRAGRPIKRYRSIADAFFIPFRVTPYATLEERLANQMEAGNRRLVRSIATVLRETGLDGRRIFRRPSGAIWNESAADTQTPITPYDPHMPAAIQFGTELHLGFEEAKELQQELWRLFLRYRERETGEGPSYLWQVAMLPAAAQ
jgi:hypothetical protein